MTQPWESSVNDATRALSVYQALFKTDLRPFAFLAGVFTYAGGHPTTEAEVYTILNAMADQNDSGTLDVDLSTAYVTAGLARLVADGFVTVGGGGVISAVHLDDSGRPRMLRRSGDETQLELIP